MKEEITIKIKQATKQGYVECPLGGVFDAAYPNSKLRRGRVQGGGKITPTITCEPCLCVFEGIETIKEKDNEDFRTD